MAGMRGLVLGARSFGLKRVLAMLLVVGLLVPSTVPPFVGAQDLTPADEMWITAKVDEAVTYLQTRAPNASTAHLPQSFEEVFRDCLKVGLERGNGRLPTLDFCAQSILSPIAGPQEWSEQIDMIARSFFEELVRERVDPFYVGAATIELQLCLGGLARTTFLNEAEAQETCVGDVRSIIPPDAFLPPPPPPTPTPIPVTPSPQPAATAVPGAVVLYRADAAGFSADNAHLTWINGGPVDTRLGNGLVELRLDSGTHRMSGPATINVTLLGDGGPEAPLCIYVRMQVEGTAAPIDGSAADPEGMIVHFDGRLTRVFDGKDCPPEKEFTGQGGVASLRFVLSRDEARNENTVVMCNLTAPIATRDDCLENPVATLRPARPS